MKVVIAFVFIVTVGAIWDVTRERRERTWPLLVLCMLIAVGFFRVYRLL